MKINEWSSCSVMKLFVWDFHGTLEKGNENAVLEITNKTLGKFGYSRRISEQEIAFLYGRRWMDYFAFLLPQEPTDVHRQLESACVELSGLKPEIVARHIRPNDYAADVLQRISANHEQILISNTEPEALAMFLKAVRMEHFFADGRVIAANSAVTHKNKDDILKEFVKGRKYESVVAIGDSPADMIGDVNYLYASSGRAFRDCRVHYRIRDLREILKEV